MKDEANCSSDQTRKCLRTGKFENLLLTGTRKKRFFALGNSDLFLISIFFCQFQLRFLPYSRALFMDKIV